MLLRRIGSINSGQNTDDTGEALALWAGLA